MTPWIDISIPIHPDMAIWPENPGVDIQSSQCMQHGDVCNVSRLSIGTHSGTHVDALRHFVKGGKSIDEAPVENFIGPARLVEIFSEDEIKLTDFDQSVISKGQRILFKTRNSRERIHDGGFQKDFIALSVEVAEWLAEMEVACVGVDYLSVGGFEGNVVEVHHALLGNGIYAVEGLILSDLEEGWYDLICLPLKIVEGDAGLTRAVARKRKGAP
ncbi:cyclase family protein [Luteolibacter sp. AS25]|uniref:cyclase family protein n=1 Tax=Luteolibacter sp. AS25 TaxID=3135776 RepID=UPI00398A59A4